MPVLFGVNDLVETEREIIISHDIIASAYFMLSRWEEYVVTARDEYDRFLENESIGVKAKFIHRAVVNEYVDYIIALSARLNCSFTIKSEFVFSATHDLDFILKWPSFRFFVKTLFGDLFKRKSLQLFVQNIKKRIAGEDPYDAYAYLHQYAHERDVKTIYYFLVDDYNRKILKTQFGRHLIKSLKENGSEFGIHPDLGSYNNEEQIIQEKQTLEEILDLRVTHSRQHFLQFQIPYIWDRLSYAGIETDSSLYYKKNPGFRTGCCSPHSTFDFLKKKTSTIIEYPLMFMEQTFKQGDDRKEVLNITNFPLAIQPIFLIGATATVLCNKILL